jgi:hypothetical protein
MRPDIKSACMPDCFTKGRACLASGDGQCPYFHAQGGGPSYNIKDFQKKLIKSITKKNVKPYKKT